MTEGGREGEELWQKDPRASHRTTAPATARVQPGRSGSCHGPVMQRFPSPIGATTPRPLPDS